MLSKSAYDAHGVEWMKQNPIGAGGPSSSITTLSQLMLHLEVFHVMRKYEPEKAKQLLADREREHRYGHGRTRNQNG
jgi:hypothetical protein